MFVVTFVDPNNKKTAYIFNETKEDKQEALKCIIKFIHNIISENVSKGYYEDADEKTDEKFYNRKIREYFSLSEDETPESYLEEKIENEYFTFDNNSIISLFPLSNIIPKESTFTNKISEPGIEG